MDTFKHKKLVKLHFLFTPLNVNVVKSEVDNKVMDDRWEQFEKSTSLSVTVSLKMTLVCPKLDKVSKQLKYKCIKRMN